MQESKQDIIDTLIEVESRYFSENMEIKIDTIFSYVNSVDLNEDMITGIKGYIRKELFRAYASDLGVEAAQNDLSEYVMRALDETIIDYKKIEG